MTTTTNDARFAFEEVDGRVRCFHLIDGKRGPEVCAGLNFHRSAWLSNWRRLVDAASLPLVEIPLQPRSVPSELVELPDGNQLVLRDAVAEFDVLCDGGKARKQLTERMSRVERGQLSSREAAALLAGVTGGSKGMAHEQIVKAFVAGALVFRDTDVRFVAEAGRLDAWFGDSGPKYVLAEIGGEISAYTTREELNRWLERDGHPDRIPVQGGDRSVGTATAELEQRSQSQRATRRDLLAPLIEAAQKAVADPQDAQAVFTVLRTWAGSKPPRAPLVGVTEDGLLQWRDSNDAPKELRLKSLRDRLRRDKGRGTPRQSAV